jgi:hypothetical protein
MSISANRFDMADAPPAPFGLLYFATFSRSQRQLIETNQKLLRRLRNEAPRAWPDILEQYRANQRAGVLPVEQGEPSFTSGMRYQALHDLKQAARAYSRLTDGRRCELYRLVCQLAKYVAHGAVQDAELRDAFQQAAEANGAIGNYGAHWADDTITRALQIGRDDPLPGLARRFRDREHGS